MRNGLPKLNLPAYVKHVAVILLILLKFANISFGRLTMFIYLIPLVYGLILKDLFTPGIAGTGVIWLFHTYIGQIEFQMLKSCTIVMVIASIGYTIVMYLFQRLNRELCYKDTITKISSRFAGISDIEKEINEALSDMGQASGVSRSYIFQFSEDRKSMNNTYESTEDIQKQLEFSSSIQEKIKHTSQLSKAMEDESKNTQSVIEAGIDAVMFIHYSENCFSNYYHNPQDIIENVNKKKLKEAGIILIKYIMEYSKSQTSSRPAPAAGFYYIMGTVHTLY